MNKKPSRTEERGSGSMSGALAVRDRLPSYIQLVPDAQCSAGDALDLLRAEVGHHGTPLADSGRTDAQRPRDIRGSLKVIKNVLFEHGRNLTEVHNKTQPRLDSAQLTSVYMGDLSTSADRIRAVMQALKIKHAAALGRLCGVSATAAKKWLDGTSVITHENATKLEAKVRWRAEWIRTGEGDREIFAGAERREIDAAAEALERMRAPLSDLLAAIDRFVEARNPKERRKQS